MAICYCAGCTIDCLGHDRLLWPIVCIHCTLVLVFAYGSLNLLTVLFNSTSVKFASKLEYLDDLKTAENVWYTRHSVSQDLVG